MVLNAVGTDVSKGSSEVCILADDMKRNASKSLKILHNRESVDEFISLLKSPDGPTKVVLESTGVYSLSLAGYLAGNRIFVSVVPPILIKDFHPTSMRNIKTDKADAKKIASYCKMVFDSLKEYSSEEVLREELKVACRYRETTTKAKVMLENSLLALSRMTFPDVEKLFHTAVSAEGKLKWVEFYHRFWHAECVRAGTPEEFKERYRKFCRQNNFQYADLTAEKAWELAGNALSFLPKDQGTRRLVRNQAKALRDLIKREKEQTDFMIEQAQLLPEYETVVSMNGVGERLGAQLIAEIGDVRRFPNRRSIVAYAGIDPKPHQSGELQPVSAEISRAGSGALRKDLFLVMSSLLKLKPEDDPVYQFLKKKQAENKPYKSYMMAGGNKFLRIYYAKVKEVLNSTDLI